MAEISGVSGPYWDRVNDRWRIQWTEDGTARIKTFPRIQRDKAFIFLSKLNNDSKNSSVQTGEVVDLITANIDYSVSAWDRVRCYCRDRLLAAAIDDSHSAVDIWYRVASGIKGLASSAANDRDISQLEKRVKEAEQQLDAITGARKHGTRVDVTTSDRAHPTSTIRRGDAIH